LSVCVLCSARVDRPRNVAWRKDGYDILRCPRCGLVFRGDLPRPDALAAIYDEAYFRDDPGRADRHGYADYLRDEQAHRANARRRLQLLSAHVGPGRLLDVGAAAGFFVDEARRAGWDASGIDVSEPMVDWGTTHLGVPLTCAGFQELESAEAFTAVTMWDYVEHSIDPRSDFEKAHELLRVGGVVALSTGDIGSFSARLSGSRWHLLTPEHHNFFFDRTTLVRLLEDTGFRVVEARHRADRYSVAHAIYKLSAVAPPLRAWLARMRDSMLGKTSLPINLFDVLTVVAERS
jgi:cyclopropane fatty-acyl-phospholipid synthase-like methyltransferase